MSEVNFWVSGVCCIWFGPCICILRQQLGKLVVIDFLQLNRGCLFEFLCHDNGIYVNIETHTSNTRVLSFSFNFPIVLKILWFIKTYTMTCLLKITTIIVYIQITSYDFRLFLFRNWKSIKNNKLKWQGSWEKS